MANQGTRAGLPFSEGMRRLHEKSYRTTQRQARNSSSVGRRQLNHAPCIIPSLTSLYFRHSMSTHPRGPVPTTLKKRDLAHRTRLGRVWICALLIDAGLARWLFLYTTTVP